MRVVEQPVAERIGDGWIPLSVLGIDPQYQIEGRTVIVKSEGPEGIHGGVIACLPMQAMMPLLESEDRAVLAAVKAPHADLVVQQWLFRSRPEPDLPPGFGALFTTGDESPILGVLTPATRSATAPQWGASCGRCSWVDV